MSIKMVGILQKFPFYFYSTLVQYFKYFYEFVRKNGESAIV